jgi:hypothetical protein
MKIFKNKAFLVLLDQFLNSSITASVPFVLINYFQRIDMIEFVSVQSWMIYYISIIESLLITPFYYIFVDDKLKFKQTIYKVCLIISTVSIGLSIFLNLFYNVPLFMLLFYVTNVYKRLSINKNISEMNPGRNIKNSIIYFTIYFSFIMFIVLGVFSFNIFILLTILNLIYIFNETDNFKINNEIKFSFIKQSFNIGKWSLYNMVIQLIITQIILYKLKLYDDLNSIIVYGLAITLTGVLNPIVSSFNNYIISYIKTKIEYSKTEFKNLVYKINFIYIFSLIFLSILIILIFPIIEGIIVKEKYDSLYLVFLYFLISLIFKSDNQFNSRVLTLIYSRKIVFFTGVLSLLTILAVLQLFDVKWETWLISAFLVSRVSSSLLSKYFLIKKLNV